MSQQKETSHITISTSNPSIWHLRKQAQEAAETLKKVLAKSEIKTPDFDIIDDSETEQHEPGFTPVYRKVYKKKQTIWRTKDFPDSDVVTKESAAAGAAAAGAAAAGAASAGAASAGAASAGAPTSVRPIIKSVDRKPKFISIINKSTQVTKPQETEDKPKTHYYTEEEKQRYSKAFNQAQEEVISWCMKACSDKVRDEINESITYIKNYAKYLIIDISNDDVIIDIDGEKYPFSASRFLANRRFQDIVRERYQKMIPEGWFSFMPGKHEGTYCIRIKMRH